MASVVYSGAPTIDKSYQRAHLPDDVHIELESLSDEDSVAEAAATATILVTGPYTPVTAAALEAAGPVNLQAILQASTGVDNIDISAATAHGVDVANVPAYCTAEVATHATGLLLAARRRIPAHDRETKAGNWDWETDRPSPRFAGSTLGLVSFGRIARQVAAYVEGFDLDILVYDPYVDDTTIDAYGVTRVGWEMLLEQSDAVSVHAPLTTETNGLVDDDALRKMQDHAILVNVGRGGIVDENALVRALEQDEIAAAALDVFETEPPEASPLLDRGDVITTPHSAWYSEDAQREVNQTIVANVKRILAGQQPKHRIESDEDW